MTKIGIITFALLLSLSAFLNVLLFSSLSDFLLIQIVLGLIGLGLDLTKALSLVGHQKKVKSFFFRIPVTLTFMAVSILASTVALNTGLALTTQELHREDQTVRILDQQIDSYVVQLSTLTETLQELPYDWPRNREMVLSQISEVRTTIQELVDQKAVLVDKETEVTSTGKFLFDLAVLLGISPEAVRISFAGLLAILIEIGIAFTASYVAQDRSSPIESIPKTSSPIAAVTKKKLPDSPYVKYVLGAFPQNANNSLKGLESVAEETGLSMYWIRAAHSALKEKGLITVTGRRSLSTVSKDEALGIASSISA